MDRLRFHLDENVNPCVAAALRQKGIDVTTSQDEGLLQLSDENQFEFARRERRVFVTHDTDFFAIAARKPEHPGVAFCEMNTRTIGEIIFSLQLMYEVLTPDELKGRIEHF